MKDPLRKGGNETMKKNHGKTSMLSILTAIALLLGSFPA